jgi:MYXO-CTERM domain-containing protein
MGMMRRIVCLLICVYAAPVMAQSPLILYEPFNYNDVGTTLEGKMDAAGDTWVGAYGSAVAPSLITVGTGSLTMPAQLPAAVGNSAALDGGPSTVATNPQQAGKALRLPFPTGTGVAADSGGTIYYSMALRVNDLTGSNNTNGGFFFSLNNSTAATTSNPSSAPGKLQMRIDPTDATKFNIGVFRNVNAAAAATSWSSALNVGDTYFLVGSVEAVAGLQNDPARLWINPAASTYGNTMFDPTTTPPTLIDNSTGSGTDVGLFSVLLRQSVAPHLTLDELRVGTTWASVTPTGAVSPLAGDYNGDHTVNAADLTVWQGSYGMSGTQPADGNGDHLVDGADFMIWQANLGNSNGGVSAVPEPAAAMLALSMVAGLGFARRRK